MTLGNRAFVSRAFVLLAVATMLIAGPLAAQPRAIHHPGGLVFELEPGSYQAGTLSVFGPDGVRFTQEFGAGDSPALGLEDAWGNALTDGFYKYELRMMPRVDDSTARRMSAARATGDDTILDVLRAEGKLPEEQSMVRYGAFTIEAGVILSPDMAEPQAAVSGGAARPRTGPLSATDQQVVGVESSGTLLTTDNGIIRNSLCVGSDCPTSPAFGDSTILMMENNTRIKFGDTSGSPFPDNDWEIEANGASSGGPNYLAFNDCGTADNDGGCTTDLVFGVEAGARPRALWVESDGDVGLGTPNPAVTLHLVDGDTPTLRLEQDTSSGFTPQTWDVAGNETNFFIRDATGGSQLPFRIQTGADSNSLFVASDNDVGIGTSSPATALHLRRTTTSRAGSATLTIEDTGGAGTLDMIEMINDGASGIAAIDSDASHEWRMVFRSTTMSIRDQTGTTDVFTLDDAPGGVGGNLTITGSIFTGGGTCGDGCDAVFEPGYELETIEDHAAEMWQNGYLPNVGPTPANAKINLTDKTGRMLNELEKAHIYIEQLSREIKVKDAEMKAVLDRLERVESRLSAAGQ